MTDQLFEVAVEVSFSHKIDESWDQVARSLLLSVKTLVSSSWQVKAFSSVSYCHKMSSSSNDVFLQIGEQLKHLSLIPSTSSKRIKRSVPNRLCPISLLTSYRSRCCDSLFAAAFRLSGGVLYILWLHVGQSSGGQQVHRAVHSTLQELIAADVDSGGRHSRAVIMSLSTAGTGELFRFRTVCVYISRQTEGWWFVLGTTVVKVLV